MYSTCILPVFYLYSTCILHVFTRPKSSSRMSGMSELSNLIMIVIHTSSSPGVADRQPQVWGSFYGRVTVLSGRIYSLTSRSLTLAQVCVLSPGPGRPSDFNVVATIEMLIKRRLGMFGVCLGMQARCGRDATEMRPRCDRDAPEMRPRCDRDATEMRPRCARPVPSSLRVLLHIQYL